MGKLRDWWPSEDMLEQSRSSSPNAAVSTGGCTAADANEVSTSLAAAAAAAAGPTSAALTFRLSEVVDALNAMPNNRTSSFSSRNSEVGRIPSSPSLPNLCLSKPAIRLTNTQAHKEELLKKLLTRSESSSDLQIGLSQKTRPASLPSSPVHSNVAQTPRKTFAAIVERGLHSKVEANQLSLNPLGSDDSAEFRKRKRDTSLTLRTNTLSPSQDAQDNILPSTPATTSPELSGIRKEALTRREIHIFSERQRRKGMTHLYTILHSLLPDAKPKTDRCTVLTEAMDYIHELQSRLSELGRQKDEILTSIGEQLQTNSLDSLTGSVMQGSGDNAESGRRVGNIDDLITIEMREEILAAADVVVRFCGRDAFITLNSPRRNGVWSAILHVLHEQDMELLNVTLSTSNDMDYHCIHAKVSNSELHSNELQKMLQEVVLQHAILD